MTKAARAWKSENQKIQIMLSRMKRAPVLSVGYEDLCRDPDSTTAEVFKFLNLPNVRVSLSGERHAVGGNPSRFDGNRVVLDDAWRAELSATQLEEYRHAIGTWAL